MALKQHIVIASTEGMRAGRDAYVAQCSKSGLTQVRAAAKKYSGRKGFARYCEDFGPAVTRAQGNAPTRTHSRTSIPARVEVETNPLEAQLASLRAQLALLEAQASAPVVATPKPASKPATTKENLWRPWAIRKYGIPQTVGGTFVYKSKKSKKSSTHQVVRVTDEGCFTVKVG
jgi:hypothetical protein